ncbi:hypothetical protein B0H17DRAFT_1204923 [Mycena rosella]|uniref:Uncharacterized protein n=1 Tax=Mycena rosella TaxID=1033263 RepID=A0AAD7D892_MYCRO|nr:hypothetical protein B0H17DRAFT_1204923 [Mycena rosella]
MFFKVLCVLAVLSFAAAAPSRGPPVFTATRVYKTITDVPPYIIDATTTITFTASPSTTFAFPTGPGHEHH